MTTTTPIAEYFSSMSSEPGGTPDTSAPTNDQALVSGLARLRRRTSLVATERWLLTAGGILLPLGAVLVLIGWYGAAHTTRIWEEVPYLISGGLFGLVLVIAGAAMYFGYWLTRLVSGDRQMLDVLLRIEERLAATGPVLPAGSGPADVTALVATKTGTMYHRLGCQVVANRAADELRAVELPAPGLTPCRLCAPPADAPSQSGTDAVTPPEADRAGRRPRTAAR